jgi:carboxymethylproline synthase
MDSSPSAPILLETLESGVLLAVFNHRSRTNPMSRELEQAIIRTCEKADADPAVEGLVFSGGIDRSFCAGGDFKEVAQLDGAGAEDWIGRVVSLYVACLGVRKPTVAAIDHHAVGLGFQLALCFDRAVGTHRCRLHMPELGNGTACTIGSYLLERCLDRARMVDLVYGCQPVAAPQALDWRILAKVVEPADLLNEACRQARLLADYPQVPYRGTKKSNNRSLIEGLREIELVSKEVHRLAFETRTASPHFEKILGRSKDRT